jgi:ABC-type tungstate transport system substrate-binding protein
MHFIYLLFRKENSVGKFWVLFCILQMVLSVNLLVLIMVPDLVGTSTVACNRGSQPEGLTSRPHA